MNAMNQKYRPIENVSRRGFLHGAAGLTLALYLPAADAAPPMKPAGKTNAPGEKPAGPPPPAFMPNAFVHIDTDSSVTVIAKHLEMGQGTHTGLATLVAEELDAAWGQVRIEGAPADAKRYNNLNWGPMQGTGGSSAMANAFMQMRTAGATARAMLVKAAADQWKVPAKEILVNEGVIAHPPTQRRAKFGHMAKEAAKLPTPRNVKLKDTAQFTLIGKSAPRKDAADKVKGSAQFTQDVRLPGMLTAVVAHPPRFGGKVKSFDATAARAVKGVVDVVKIPSGVAVLARDTWSAKKGRDALKVEWDETDAFKRGSEEIFARYREMAKTPGKLAKKTGDAEAAFTQAAKVLTASYDFPYLAHAPMEPLNCVVALSPGKCEIWNGEQMQTVDQMKISALLGLRMEQVVIHMLYAGGSFGRRASKDSDYVLEAVSIARASNGRAPVKLVWLREDDMQAGYYRPLFHHRLEAALDKDNKLIAWRQRLVGQSIAAGSPFAMMVKNGIDPTSVEGAANLPYAIPNLQVELATPDDITVPVLWWRSVGSTHTAFSTETFIDEIAAAAKQDAVAFRLELLAEHPRHANVLKEAAQRAGWGSPLAAGRAGERRGRGVAVHESFHSFVAQVVEVTVGSDGAVKVERVVCAVDCGLAINPDIVRAQVEGSVAFALSAALQGEITLKEGRVEQSNFHDYAPIRINQMPQVDVFILPSGDKPTGMGEPAVPPLAPALANAIFAATGKRIYRLPIRSELLKA